MDPATTTRGSFTPEYKLEAVRAAVRAAERSGNAAQTARDLGVAPKLIHRWTRELHDDGRRAFPGNGGPRDEELARLERELRQAREEVAVLKKAVGRAGSRPQVSSPSR